MAVCDQIKLVLAPGAKMVNADLYKLLVYGRGDFFCVHQDAQHSARMFATLLYKGGEFRMCEPGRLGRYQDEDVIEDRRAPDECGWVYRCQSHGDTGGGRISSCLEL